MMATLMRSIIALEIEHDNSLSNAMQRMVGPKNVVRGKSFRAEGELTKAIIIWTTSSPSDRCCAPVVRIERIQHNSHGFRS